MFNRDSEVQWGLNKFLQYLDYMAIVIFLVLAGFVAWSVFGL